MCKWLTAWRNDPELAYLKEPPVHVLQSILSRLDDAYQDFFNKRGTGWQSHTVRGTFAGAFKKKLGLAPTSEKAKGGDRVYRREG